MNSGFELRDVCVLGIDLGHTDFSAMVTVRRMSDGSLIVTDVTVGDFKTVERELNHSNIRLMGRPAPAPGMECFKETSNERKKLEAVAEKTEQPKDWYRAFEKKRKPYKRNLK